MKHSLLISLTLTLALTLAACATPATSVPFVETTPVIPVVAVASTPTPFAATYLSTEYADAASLRNQLAFGALKLEGAASAVTPEQARTLLPLWQAIVALSGSETTAEAELMAVQNQIAEAMTPEQLQTIAAMQITNADLTAFYAGHGIVLPTPAPGVTKMPGGGNSGLSQADKEATRTAAEALGTPVGAGGGAGQAAKTLLFDAVIELLTARAEE
jgi:hypothetical protein